jgi:large subunit ribosomal protein L13
MKNKTTWTTQKDITRKWYVVDVKGKVLGRVSTQIASLLIGKNKVEQVPNLDCGDYVVVLNSDKIKLTRGKEKKKTYFRHSGYPGGAKEITFDKQMLKNSKFVIEKAVTNMLPNNKLRSSMLTRLFVYEGTEHSHEAQKPEVFNL